jgi:hypothetical protein
MWRTWRRLTSWDRSATCDTIEVDEMGRHLLVLALVAGCRSAAQPPEVVVDAWVPLDAPATLGAGNGGGMLDELRFAVIGDTRPANLDDTAHYPSDIVRQIWTAVEAEQPHPSFAVTTGDYMFASIAGHEQAPQLDLYLAARAAYRGIVYPALGNHECDGYTKSNCGPGGVNGLPANYTAYLQRMVEPLGEHRPYFVERFAATDGSWTAKFVFVAANAWSSDQAGWLERALSEPTTYTFVVRHEPHDADTAPGTTPSGDIMTRHPLTILITGHTHTYRNIPAYREIIVGNGGAPLTSGVNYGYVIIARGADGLLTVTSYDYASHAIVDQFAITPAGLAP